MTDELDVNDELDVLVVNQPLRTRLTAVAGWAGFTLCSIVIVKLYPPGNDGQYSLKGLVYLAAGWLCLAGSGIFVCAAIGSMIWPSRVTLAPDGIHSEYLLSRRTWGWGEIGFVRVRGQYVQLHLSTGRRRTLPAMLELTTPEIAWLTEHYLDRYREREKKRNTAC